MRRLFPLVIFALFIAFVQPVFAQDETPDVPPAATVEQMPVTVVPTLAPTSTPPAGEPSDSDNEVVGAALELAQLAVYVVMLILVYKSVPASVVEKLLEKAAIAAKKTATPIDDVVVDVGGVVIEKLIEARDGAVDPHTAPTKLV